MEQYDAGLYDYYQPGLPGEAEWYAALAAESGGPLLELGSGTGRTLFPIAEAGIEVVGLEQSETMLEVAQGKLAALPYGVRQRVQLIQGDMREFDLRRRFPLITAPYRVFLHMLTAAEQEAALQEVRRHLQPGGRLALNIFDPDLDTLAVDGGAQGGALHRDSEFVVEETGRRYVVWYSRKYYPLSQVIQQFELIEEIDRDGRVVDRRYVPMLLRVVFRYEMQRLLELCGFEIEALYGDFNRGPFVPGSEQVWMVKKAE